MASRQFSYKISSNQAFLTHIAVLLLLCTTIGGTLQAVSPNHKVNSSSYTPKNPSIAIDSSNVSHVVWQDTVNGKQQIFYAKSSDGESWSTQKQLSTSTADSERPRIAAHSGSLYVVWQDAELGHEEVYFLRSTDSGVTWGGSALVVANDNYLSTGPDIAVASDGTICIVWEDHRSGKREIYYSLNTNSGASFSGSGQIFAQSSSLSLNTPRVVADTNDLFHMVWFGGNDIYYNNSQTPNSPVYEQNLSNSTYPSKNPAITTAGNDIHVVWQDYNDFNWNIHYKTYSLGSWQTTVTTLIENPGTSEHPAITSDSSKNIHVVWQDRYDGNSEIYYRKRENGQSSTSWETVVKLTDNESGDATTPVAIASNTSDTDNGVHAVWVYANDIYYTKLPKNGLSGSNPDVTEIFPAENATGVAPNSKIYAVFDTDMQTSSVEDSTTFKLYKETSNGSNTWTEVTGSLKYYSSSRKITFSPDSTLAFSTKHKVSITSQAMNTDGERFVGKIWYFTTSSDLVSGSGSLKIGQALAYPSPWNGDGYINLAYSMEYDTAESIREAWISIYGPGGRRLYKERADSTGGASIHEWDGIDSRGNELGNGLYFFKVTATLTNGEKAEAEGTIMIIR